MTNLTIQSENKLLTGITKLQPNLIQTLCRSLDCSEQRLKIISEGNDMPIRSLDKLVVANTLSATLILCATMYCGAQQDRTEPETIKEAVRFVYRRFGFMGIAEIKEAFSMSASKQLPGVDIKAYFGTFTISLLGDILDAYKKYRQNAVVAIQKSLDKIRIEEEAAIKKQALNQKAISDIVEEIKLAIKAARDGFGLYESWQNIPIHYPDIAIKNGLINLDMDKKEVIWARSKDIALYEIQMTISISDRISDIKSARALLKRVTDAYSEEAGKQKETPEEFLTKRKVIYSKLLLWEYLKPDINE